MSVTGEPSGHDNIYETLESYNWDDDVEFQSGLSAILGSNSSPEQAVELTLRARCFYYSRKYNVNIDFDAYKAFRDSRSHQPITANGVHDSAPSTSTESAGGILPNVSTDPNEPPVPYPTSFAHIVELVTTGQPIPGIKEIPNTILTGQGTQPAQPKRKKPWEKDESSTSQNTEGQGTAT